MRSTLAAAITFAVMALALIGRGAGNIASSWFLQGIRRLTTRIRLAAIVFVVCTVRDKPSENVS